MIEGMQRVSATDGHPRQKPPIVPTTLGEFALAKPSDYIVTVNVLMGDLC